MKILNIESTCEEIKSVLDFFDLKIKKEKNIIGIYNKCDRWLISFSSTKQNVVGYLNAHTKQIINQ